MSNLPKILGGEATFKESFQPYITIGEEEKKAVLGVLESGESLSGFIGAWVPQFFGGKKVKELEENWCRHFGVKHAIAMNSATSGLYSAIGAIGIEPGDEVIVTPVTMTATVTGIVVYQAIPIFADILEDTFCIDPDDVERKITSKTKAIIGVNIYGENANWMRLREIAKKYNLLLIEDAAQSIGGDYNGKKSGTWGDIGVYSLNRHKHIQCGEGGVCVTNNDEFADRLRLIRNHGEAVVGKKGTTNLVNILGFNYRMTELEAAVAIEQLKKLDQYVLKRRQLSKKVIEIFSGVEGITVPINLEISPVPSTNIFYYITFKLNKKILGISRKAFVKALVEEGMPIIEGGYEPNYYQPMYQQKIAFGSKGYPFTASYYGKDVSYSKGICPVAERMWEDEVFCFMIQNYVPNDQEVKLMKDALVKVLKHKDEIEKKFGNS